MLKAVSVIIEDFGVGSLNGLTGNITLTSTGNTITITPSGNTIDLEASSSSPTVIAIFSFPYTAPASPGLTFYNLYAASVAVTYNLPASPSVNQICRIVDAGCTASLANPITINGNGENIVAYGSETNISIQIASAGQDIWLAWDGSNWT